MMPDVLVQQMECASYLIRYEAPTLETLFEGAVITVIDIHIAVHGIFTHRRHKIDAAKLQKRELGAGAQTCHIPKPRTTPV